MRAAQTHAARARVGAKLAVEAGAQLVVVLDLDDVGECFGRELEQLDGEGDPGEPEDGLVLRALLDVFHGAQNDDGGEEGELGDAEENEAVALLLEGVLAEDGVEFGD